MRRLLLALCLCLGQGALAQEIERSPLPVPNPRLAGVAAAPPTEAAVTAGAEAADTPETVPPGSVLLSSLRPVPRPRALTQGLAALKATSNAPGLDLSGKVPDDDMDLAAMPPPSKKEERKKKRETASRKGSVLFV